MKVVVTGGAGFIGANLVRELLLRPSIDEVVVIDDLSTGFATNLQGLDATFIEGSILDDELLVATMRGAKAVVHLAARPSVPRSIVDPIASHEANATGTLRVLQAARDLDDPLVILASSSSVYGANPTLPKVESMLAMPMSPYAVSKLACFRGKSGNRVNNNNINSSGADQTISNFKCLFPIIGLRNQ